MENKFTPGPWSYVDGFDLGYTTDYWVRASDEVGVCEINYSLEEANANTRLIASAPLLLEALEGMIEVFGYDADGLECIEAARQAIAKAKGE